MVLISRSRRIYRPALMLVVANIVLRLPDLSLTTTAAINILLSSYLLVSVWMLTFYLFRWQVALLAPLLLLFDTQLHIAELSDTRTLSLALLTFSSLSAYYIGATRHQPLSILASGLALGCAMTIDAKLVLLIPLIVVFNLYASRLILEQYNPLSFFKAEILKPKFGWWEAWAFLVLLFSLGLFKGELFYPVNSTASLFRDLGSSVAEFKFIFSGLALTLTVAIWMREKQALSNSGFHISAILCTILAISAFNPAIFESAIRCLDHGLSSVQVQIWKIQLSTSLSAVAVICLIGALVTLIFDFEEFSDKEAWSFYAVLTGLIIIFMPPLIVAAGFYVAGAVMIWKIGFVIGMLFGKERAQGVAEGVSTAAVLATMILFVTGY